MSDYSSVMLANSSGKSGYMRATLDCNSVTLVNSWDSLVSRKVTSDYTMDLSASRH